MDQGNKVTRVAAIISAVMLLGISQNSLALSVSNSGISATLQTSQLDPEGNTQYGGCMARLIANSYFPTTDYNNLPCGVTGDTLVTFDCAGLIGTKSAGSANFEAAQLAFVSGKSVGVNITASTLNGFCYVDRIDVFNYPVPE